MKAIIAVILGSLAAVAYFGIHEFNIIQYHWIARAVEVAVMVGAVSYILHLMIKDRIDWYHSIYTVILLLFVWMWWMWKFEFDNSKYVEIYAAKFSGEQKKSMSDSAHVLILNKVKAGVSNLKTLEDSLVEEIEKIKVVTDKAITDVHEFVKNNDDKSSTVSKLIAKVEKRMNTNSTKEIALVRRTSGDLLPFEKKELHLPRITYGKKPNKRNKAYVQSSQKITIPGIASN